MSNSITLTASMRSNLSSLKSLANQMSTTQTRLSTGKKVNSAIDNASSYYQARSLNNRAADLDALLDAMGQGIQTIAAANEGVEAGLKMIEQMKSVAQSAITAAGNSGGAGKLKIDAFYDGRTNTQAIIDQIGEDGLAAYATTQFYAPGITADDENFGQGKWYLPAIGELMDAYGEFETKYYKIDTYGDEIEISQEEYAQLQKDGYYIKIEYNYETEEENRTIINQAEYDQFVSEYGNTWVGTATGEIFIDNGLYSEARPTSNNKQAINDTLSLLAERGAEAQSLSNNDYYWSSSDYSNGNSWLLSLSNGNSYINYKNSNSYVRAFSLLENKFSANATKPELGDVMYSDLSYGKATDYDGSKTAVGVVTWVSDDGASARIMSLKELAFSSYDTVNNFDPEHPYSGSVYTRWAAGDKWVEDISGVENIYYLDLGYLYETSSAGTMGEAADFSTYNEQFNALYEQYDKLIQDASYQGINLLNGGDLNVIFNESRSHSYTVEGQHADAASLGLTKADWHSAADIETAINQLQDATSSLRRISEELGNSYAVITNREKFTDALIDVLQTGADNLVLADMNEESANYLALQTRQQLAINALSLAAQSGSAVLKLF